MEISIQLRKKARGISESGLRTFAAQARSATGLRGSIGIVITSDAEVRSMNQWFRGIDKTTDVLSFPSELKGHAGDIAISLDLARSAAREMRHGISDEVKVLILHGMLHLAGFDHEQDDGRMASEELALRRRLRLPAALIERNNHNAPRPRKAARRSRAKTA